jgi:hypothetical protein
MPGTWKRGGNAGKGRKPGVPNKATADVKAIARQYGPAAIGELARLATKAESETAGVAAIKEILDRAYGKSTITADVNVKRDVRHLSDNELAAIITQGLDQVTGEATGEDDTGTVH